MLQGKYAASFTGYQEKNTDIKVIIFVTKIIRKEMRRSGAFPALVSCSHFY